MGFRPISCSGPGRASASVLDAAACPAGGARSDRKGFHHGQQHRQFQLFQLRRESSRPGTDGEQTILFDVLDARYRDMRPTIMLTNQGAEGLRGYLGDRTFDRVRETSKFVAFDWESYRPMARDEQQGATA